MIGRTRWVLLAYRLPREPSTPRITLWRHLRRLGAAQVADGVVALPLDARTREQLEWLAEDVVERGGEASIWLAEPGTLAQERALARRMLDVVEADLAALIAEAALMAREPDSLRRRTLARLRRDLGRIRSRDYFASPMAARAEAAVESLAATLEAVA
jgi:ChrB-like protein